MTIPTGGARRDQLDSGTCKGCGAAILWANTVIGRRIPLDEKAERRFVESVDVPGVVVQRDVYTPHHMTCPNANDFRKPAAEPAPDTPPADDQETPA